MRYQRGSIGKRVSRFILQFLRVQDIMLGQLSCHAMQWRGFSDAAVHPKHLFDEDRGSLLQSMFKPGINYLDVGSGVGSDCILAKQQGASKVFGVEGNQKNIEKAMMRAQKAGVSVEFICYDLEKASLPFDDDFFDLINFSNVLEHLDNRIAILRDIGRKKKKDGLIVLSVPNSGTTWKKKLRAAGLDSYDDSDHKIEYTKQSLIEELDHAGLKIISDLFPLIPSFPWNGLIAMSAMLSPRLYRRFQKAKYRFVEQKPEESMGWVFLVQ